MKTLPDRFRWTADDIEVLEPGRKFDDSQPRDDHGRWTSGGGGGSANFDTAEHLPERQIGEVGETTKRYSGWYSALPDEQKRALIQWQEWGEFPQIQSLLRQQPIPLENNAPLAGILPMEESQVPHTLGIIYNLDAAIASAPPLPNDTVVYRSFDSAQYGELHTGQVLRDDGFVATGDSRDAANASGSLLDPAPQHSDVSAEILLPAGTRVGVPPIDGWFTGTNDTQVMSDELVVPRGSSFTVVSTDPVRLTLTDVPSTPPPIPSHAPKSAPQPPKLPHERYVWHLGDLVDVTKLNRKFDENQPRDDHGRWSAAGDLTVRDLADPTKKFPEPRELPVFGLTQKAQDEVYARLERVGITHAALCEEIANRIGPADSALMDEARGWYPAAHDTAASIADSSGGRIDQEHAEAVIAALSPQMEWDANVNAAEKLTDYVATGNADGKTPEQAALDFIEKQATDAAALDQGKMFQTADNVTKAMAIAMGGSIDDNLTGMKVRSFFNNIDDPNDTRDVTIDTHMAKVLTAVSPGLVKEGTTNGSALGLLNASSAKEGQQYGGAGYIAISEAVRSVSSQLGVPPDAVQAAYWLSVRDISYDDIKPATP